jgi:poly-gamma-glutamate synthesis protein (capsule biosynthesis protein)
VDVLVGGHPHVIQPFETITAENGNKTLCIYSTGNFLSNQRKHEMTGIAAGESGYTEDGMIFGITFQRWSDGAVSIGGVEILPLWVNMENRRGRRVYQIVPVDPGVTDWSKFELNANTLRFAKDSYNRTMSLVGEGLNSARAAMGLPPVPTTAP